MNRFHFAGVAMWRVPSIVLYQMIQFMSVHKTPSRRISFTLFINLLKSWHLAQPNPRFHES